MFSFYIFIIGGEGDLSMMYYARFTSKTWEIYRARILWINKVKLACPLK